MSDKPGPSGRPRKDFTWTRVPENTLNLAGQQIAVIGGTGGLGRALALSLASKGATVTVVGQTFRDAGKTRLTFMKADLSLMTEARRVGRELPAEKLDMVVMTTGIFAAPERQVTPEGIERDLAVSYLSRLAVLRELAPRLGKARPQGARRPRVFVMGYPGTNQAGTPGDLNAEKSYEAMPVHMNTVAGNEALVVESAERYPGIDFFGLNPGLVKTNIRANFLGEGTFKHRAVEFLIGVFSVSPEKYAQVTVPLLVAADLEGRGPAMFNQKGIAIQASAVMTSDYARGFIRASEELLARAVPRNDAQRSATAAG